MINEIEKELKQLREYAKKKYIPVMRQQTSEVLKKCLIKANPKKILEIGTSIGTSGILSLAYTNAKLVTIEKDEDTLFKAKKNFEKAGFSERVEFILGDCFEILMIMEKSFDFVILDGPKGHIKELFELVFPMLIKGGKIFIDNINYHNRIKKEGKIPHKHRTIVTNIRNFLTYISEATNIKTKTYDIDDGILIIEKE